MVAVYDTLRGAHQTNGGNMHAKSVLPQGIEPQRPAGSWKDVFYAAFGVESWKNKFGNNAALLAGSKYTVPTVNFEANF